MANYFAVKYGHDTRITTKKCDTPEEACRECYGLVSNTMLVKCLGKNKRPIQVARRLKNMLEAKEGWKPPIIKNTKLGVDV
jgi:hypothetical protein